MGSCFCCHWSTMPQKSSGSKMAGRPNCNAMILQREMDRKIRPALHKMSISYFFRIRFHHG